MAATQQQFVMVQAQLASAEEQITTISTALDNMRSEASAAIKELRVLLIAEQQKTDLLQKAYGNNGRKEKDWALVNSKEFAGGKFSGAKGEEFRGWAKKVKVFANGHREGFKKLLEIIEKDEDAPVDQRLLKDLNLNWEYAVTAAAKLADFLQTYCQADALRIVEACPENGLEAWRLLKKRYDPASGKFELGRMNRMLSRKQCKELSDLPAAIDVLEKDIRGYESSMGAAFPVEWKMPLLLQILPEIYKHELEAKYTMGERDFDRMCENISRFANERRIAEGRGRKDMEVDALNDAKPTSQEKEDDWEIDWLAKAARKVKEKENAKARMATTAARTATVRAAAKKRLENVGGV